MADPVLPEPPSMAKLTEDVNVLSARLASLEARLAPKPRPVKTGLCRTGWRPGRQRFGYRPHPKVPWRLVEDFDEQQTINVILQCRAQDPTVGSRAICTYLDNLGLKRRGKRWTPNGHSLVRAILKRAR